MATSTELAKVETSTELADEDGKAFKNPNADPKPPIKELGVAIGVDANLPFSTPYQTERYKAKSPDEQLYELQRELGYDVGPTVRELVTMRRMDGQARALYRLLTLPIRAALSTSSFVPADGGDEEAEFIDQVFHLPPEQGGMSVTFHHVMAQMLSGLFDGFAPFEQVYDYAKYGPLKGKWVLSKLAYRPPETITFVTRKDGSFAGMRQRAYVNGESIDKFIPRERCFYYAAQEEEKKFYGVSFFQSAFYHYDKKIKTYFTAHLAAQRAAVGTRVGTVPVNATPKAVADFGAALGNLAFAQHMMMPEGFTVDVQKEGGTFDFLALINHHNSQMSKSLLAGFFDKEQGAGASEGSLVNFAQPGDDMFVLMLRAIMDDIANSINHYIIPRLIDWNFDSGKYPVFTWSALTDEQKAAIAGSFDKLSTAGQSMTVTPEFMREIEKKMAKELGLEIDYDEIESREEEEALAQEQLLADQAKAQADMEASGQEVDQFQQQAAGGGQPLPVEDPKLKLSAGSEDLVKLASKMLDEAGTHLSLSGQERRVETKEGEEKYGVPIGTVIKDRAPAAKPEKVVTIERLLSLKSQLENARRLGNKDLILNIVHDLSYAVRQYGVGKTPEQVRSVLKQIAPNVDPEAFTTASHTQLGEQNKNN